MTADLARTEEHTASPMEFRGSVFTLMVLGLEDPRDPTFYSRLADKIAQAPNFFRNAPVVVDLKAFPKDQPINLAEVGRRLRQHQLLPVGIQNGTDDQNLQALNAGFAVMPAGAPKRPDSRSAVGPTAVPVPVATETQEVPPPAESPPEAPADASVSELALTITQPVRSGQQIYACRRDLVVLASVSPGAELLADGHIHIYGALRGRAIAGVSGDLSARIFCHSLEAELVSVSGYWMVRDDIPDNRIGKPAQIFLRDGEHVEVAPLP